MRRAICALLIAVCTISADAQAPTDGVVITPYEGSWTIVHRVAIGETPTTISHAYHIPLSILAETNMLSYSDSLKPGTRIYIPLGSYNQKNTPPHDAKAARKLYYRLKADDNIKLIAANAKVPIATLQKWNGLTTTATPLTGTLLQVGWLLYTPPTHVQKDITPPAENPKYVLGNEPDTTHHGIHSGGPLYRDSTTGIVPPLQVLWNEQTFNGKNAVTEKASAGFFQLAGKATGGADTYAFHSMASRGSVIRVKNIANGRVIYVKVLGPVPNTKQYYGCSIGLSTAAKASLGVRENKAFVELSYAGY